MHGIPIGVLHDRDLLCGNALHERSGEVRYCRLKWADGASWQAIRKVTVLEEKGNQEGFVDGMRIQEIQKLLYGLRIVSVGSVVFAVLRAL